MVAGREFRHHATERRVNGDLARQALGPDATVRLEHGHAGLIATGFDS
jgi:hypothetical protein